MTDMIVEPTVKVNPKIPDIEQLETEDDAPVDNMPSEKQQRLLVDPLYSSWQIDRPFIAAANVGLFRAVSQPPIVPDMFLSLDVQVAEDWWAKENRSYFLWEFGKPPEVVVEVVSNRKGQEADRKMAVYAQLGTWYYVIFDPQKLIQAEALRVYELYVGAYVLRPDQRLEKVDLSLSLWKGTFEDKQADWLRWCDLGGKIIPTGSERAEQERERAEQERERADQERERADQERERAEQERERAEQERERANQERERAERLARQLKELGIDPEA